jgi:fermentation-respiration switch protein FrsA (DUF1100 family)
MSGWLRVLLWSIGGVVALVALLWTFQRRLIYLPGRDIPPVTTVLPDWMDTAVTTSDGEALGVWYSPPPIEGAPIVIVFNGNAGTRADRATLGEALAQNGYGVVLFDYRGYGNSTGAPSEAGLARDATAVVDFAAGTAPDSPVVYFGESLGAAVAIGLAEHQPPDALVLRSPFTSLADVARFHYRLPLDLLLRDRYPSEITIERVDVPTLVVAGSADTIVPMSQSRRIHAAAPGPKQLVIVEGAGHNDYALLAGAELIESVVAFLGEHVPDGS